jgi:adenylate cyclase
MNAPRPGKVVPLPSPGAESSRRLDSWKEIASYLKRGARTVQRWEREDGLPVHRLPHGKLGSVYAYPGELDAWWRNRGEQAPEDEEEAAPSIAVLPFSDLGPENDQQHVSEGIAEEIINRLARIKALRVPSRTSSFQSRMATSDIREIGRRLRVGAVLEGSVRRAGDRLRITVQLANVASGYQIWSARYDREMSDVFALQDEIAQRVVEALQVTLSTKDSAPSAPPTKSLRAYEFYLQGRRHYYQYGPDDMDRAVRLFMQAVRLDPEYAQAYAGLADCWSYIYLYSDRSEMVREQAAWASAKAVELSPGSAVALASYGLSLAVAGRTAEADAAFEGALALDPALYEACYFYARHCFAAGRREKALELYEAAMRARPEDYQAPLLAAQTCDDLGRTQEGATLRRRGVDLAAEHLELNPEDARALYCAANGMVALGERERGLEWARRARALQPENGMLLYNLGCIYSMAGLPDEAMDCLERAVAGGLTQRAWYERDSNLDGVRGQTRFQRLLGTLE